MARRMSKSDLHWLTVAEAMERYSISRRTVFRYLAEMESCGRYPDGIVIRTPAKTLVLDAAMHDYIKNVFGIKNRLKIPPYNAEDMRIELMRLTV